MPKFTLLLSIYKSSDANELDMALHSICISSLRPSQLCLVFDGAVLVDVEGVVSKYKKYLPIEEIRLEQNIGLGPALNAALPFCKFDWVARFDADDVCHPERFQRQFEFLRKNPDVDLLSSWVGEFDETPESCHSIRKVPRSHTEIVSYSKYRNPFNHMAVVFRKSAVMAVGGYQACYLYEDYDLWMRMLHSGARSANVDEVLVYARVGNGMGMRRGGWSYLLSEFKSLSRFYRSGYIALHHYLIMLLIRVPARIIPPSLRLMFYRYILR